MMQLTLDKSRYPFPSPDPRDLPEGVCPECEGTGKASMEAGHGR